jgi:hypothetical protein
MKKNPTAKKPMPGKKNLVAVGTPDSYRVAMDCHAKNVDKVVAFLESINPRRQCPEFTESVLRCGIERYWGGNVPTAFTKLPLMNSNDVAERLARVLGIAEKVSAKSSSGLIEEGKKAPPADGKQKDFDQLVAVLKGRHVKIEVSTVGLGLMAAEQLEELGITVSRV